MAGFEIVKKVYPEFEEKSLKWKDIIRADTVSGLLETVLHLDEDLPVLALDENFELEGATTQGGGMSYMVQPETKERWLILGA